MHTFQLNVSHVQVLGIRIAIFSIHNPKNFNVIIGCIYRYPSVKVNESSDRYLSNLLNKVSKENKSMFLLGDFNVDLLRYDQNTSGNKFLNSL